MDSMDRENPGSAGAAGDAGDAGSTEGPDVREVREEVRVNLILSPERSVPVPARFRYLADDPYAKLRTQPLCRLRDSALAENHLRDA